MREGDLSTPLRGTPFSPKRGDEESAALRAISFVSSFWREMDSSLDGIERSLELKRKILFIFSLYARIDELYLKISLARRPRVGGGLYGLLLFSQRG
jgi:hypothetical protein